MKQISIDQDVFDFLTSKANVPDEPPSAVLRRELRVPLDSENTRHRRGYLRLHRCENRGDWRVGLRHPAPGTASRRQRCSTLRPRRQPRRAPPPRPSSFTFRVAQERARGTMDPAGSSRRLETRFGSSTTTRWHTGSTRRPTLSAPRAAIFPGGSADFLLMTTFDPNADGPLSDHEQGQQALFFLEVRAA